IMFFQVGQCALRSPKIAAQKQKNRCVLRDGVTRVMVKGSLRTGSEGVKVDQRMPAFAWRGDAAKLLFRIAPTWIENSQSKILCAPQCHCKTTPRIGANTDDENDEALMTKDEGMTKSKKTAKYVVMRISVGTLCSAYWR